MFITDPVVPLVRPASTFPLVEETTKMSTANDESRFDIVDYKVMKIGVF